MSKPRPLGTRQAEVLRAAANGNLVRFDDGGWGVPSGACTAAARTVAHLLADGEPMAVCTLGSGRTRRGRWMDLTPEGRAALDAYDAAHPEDMVARQRRADAIRALAGKTGDDLLAGIRDLAAADTSLDDDAYVALSQALRGETPTD